MCTPYPSRIFRLFLVLNIFCCLIGCTVANKTSFPLPEVGIYVKEDKIYNKDSLFAELRYLSKDEQTGFARGVAIFYYPYNTEEWIYPKGGWKAYKGDKDKYSIKEIEKEWDKKGIRGFMIDNKRADKGEAIAAWCYDVKISDDGKYVYYKTKGIFHDSSQRYNVESGE